MDTLLVIDDEPGIRRTITDVLESDTLRVVTAENALDGLRLLREESPSVVLLDIRLGRDSGLELFEKLRSIDPKVLVIFITGHGTSEVAIETMKRGAFDYLLKPLDFDQLQQTIDTALKISRLMRTPATVNPEGTADEMSDRLIGNGSRMQTICKQIGRIAPQDVNVLVLGESGTGKELVTRAIYQHSRRNQAPFLAINCAAIPETLLESELFGHEKGAFSGAERQRIGKFEQVHQGTIFLDEVGDMPLSTQTKILRLLQDGQFQRVGGNETLTTDVRILAATNQNLDSMIEQGRFRQDLYYRLRGVTLHLPPLRERQEDIAELSHYFMFRFNRQLGTTIQTIAPEALERLKSYRWPGNIRELQSVIRESLIVSTGPTLLPEFLPEDLQSDPMTDMDMHPRLATVGQETWRDLGEFIEHSIPQELPNLYRVAIRRFDQFIVTLAMKHAGDLQSKAAQILSLSRPTLRSKLREIEQTDLS